MRHLPFLTLLLFSLFLASPASAKDLRKRFGLGFNDQFGSFSAISARFCLPNRDPAVNFLGELDLGMRLDETGLTQDGVLVGGRLLYAVVVEDNMNLYAAAGAGLIFGDTQALRLEPGVSMEFFLFGLENLGFSAEWGLAIDVGSPSSLSSFAGLPGVGVHYYF